MPTANITHDISIREASTAESTALGFMLSANRDRLRGHKVGAARTIQPRVLSMGELTEAEAPVEIELLWFQENWQLGIGGINHRLDPRKIAFGLNIDTSHGDIRPASDFQTIGTDSSPDLQAATGFATVADEMWAFLGRDTYKLQSSGPEQWVKTVDGCGDPPDDVAKVYKNGVEFDGNTYVPGWTTSGATPLKYIFKADADTTWTVHPGVNAPNDFKYFASGVNASGAPVLWGAYQGATNNVIRSATDPSSDTTATWDTAVAIGSTDSEITALVVDGNTLLVCKTNGIWAFFQDATSRNLTPEFESAAFPNNFRGAFNWNGHVLLPLGRGGMVELNEGRLFDVSMELYAPNADLHDTNSVIADFHTAQVTGLAGDPTTLFMMIAAGTSNYLLMARWVEFQNERDFRWHLVRDQTVTGGVSDEYQAIFADGTVPEGGSLIDHRIWIGHAPTNNDLNPFFYTISENDHSHLFTQDTSTAATTVVFDGNFPRVDKVFQKADFEFLNLGAEGRTIEVEYSLDAATYLCLGTLNSTSNAQTLTFPDGTTGKTLELRFFPKDASCQDKPETILRSFRVTSQLRPTKLNQLDLKLYLADNQMLLNGAVEGKQVANLAQLRTWSDQAAEVTVKDSEGTEKDMVMLPGTLEVVEVAHERGRRPEYEVSVSLVETG